MIAGINLWKRLAIVAVVTLALAQAEDASAADRRKKAGPPKAEEVDPFGRPKLFIQGKRKMYGIWYEDGIWRLRTTSGRGVRVEFLGTVEVDSGRVTPDFTALDRSKKRRDADLVRVSKNRRKMDFRFITVGLTDGIDFKVDKRTKMVGFKLRTDDDDDPKFILIGAKGEHPAKNVFYLPAHPKKAESKER